MKSKLVILSLLMAGAAVTATAQTKEKYFSEKAGDNIYIGIGGGVQASLSQDNRDAGLGDAITPQISFTLGKWFTPVWGIRGQATGWESILNTNYNNGTISNDNVVYGSDQEVSVNYANVHLDAVLNLSNLFGGYNPNRIFTVSAFAGPGITYVTNYPNEAKVNYTDNNTKWTRTSDEAGRFLINGSVGLMGQFNVSRYIDINIEARGELSPSYYGKLGRAYTDGAVSLTAGVAYTFGGKKFVTCPKVDQDAINAEINKYRQALADAEAELAAARNALANAKPVTKEVVKEVQVAGPRAIFFQIGKSNIDDYGMVNTKLAAKIIKANPDKKYKVTGYADKATGSTSWNKKLSEKRAQNVYDALIKEGVDSSQLECVGFGEKGNDDILSKDKLNRVVILE